jgi:hypothetical protein
VKRLGTKSLSLVWTKDNNVSSSLKSSLLKSLQFILTQVLPKIESSKLRVEAYLLLGNKAVSEVQDCLKKYVQVAPLLYEDPQKLSLYVRNMCRTIMQAQETFNENTFSDFFICYSLYKQLISGVYCSERVSKKWLQERPMFGLKRKLFLFPTVRMNLGLLELSDLEREKKSLNDIFGPDLWNILLLLFLKEATETNLVISKCLAVIKEASENLEVILAKIFPSCQTDYDSTYVDLRSLFQKQLTVHSSFEKSLTCHILLRI